VEFVTSRGIQVSTGLLPEVGIYIKKAALDGNFILTTGGLP
jgi:hypothetical protein